MRKGLATLYSAYGGFGKLLKSPYLWLSAVFGLIVAYSSKNLTWPDLAISTIPSLTGFSIAAFAIFFSILTDTQRSILLEPRRSGVAPLVSLLSTVGHAIIVQVFALFSAGLAISLDGMALVRVSELFYSIYGVSEFVVTKLVPFIGATLVFYSWLLMIAIALDVFALLGIVSRIKSNNSGNKSGSDITPPSP